MVTMSPVITGKSVCLGVLDKPGCREITDADKDVSSKVFKIMQRGTDSCRRIFVSSRPPTDLLVVLHEKEKQKFRYKKGWGELSHIRFAFGSKLVNQWESLALQSHVCRQTQNRRKTTSDLWLFYFGLFLHRGHQEYTVSCSSQTSSGRWVYLESSFLNIFFLLTV